VHNSVVRPSAEAGRRRTTARQAHPDGGHLDDSKLCFRVMSICVHLVALVLFFSFLFVLVR
jgi:hypothetical protein